MALSLIEEHKLSLILRETGSLAAQLTPDEALELAIQAEQTAKECGPFDPAFSYFSKTARNFETLAFLLEKQKCQPD